jgi:tubulin polyglutamylase TTLL9
MAKVIKYKTYLYNTVLDALASMGWQQVEGDASDWDVYWCDTAFARETYTTKGFQLKDGAMICHFPHHYELTRKDMMAKNLKTFRRQLEKDPTMQDGTLDCSFMPETFWLPHDYGIFVELFKKLPGSVWIMKPVGSAQGKGIFLIKKLKEILDFKRDHRFKPGEEKPDTQAYIVQRYLERPYLIFGKKFDLRLYVLVTSYQPLQVWVYREGFARFSGFPFSMEDISNNQVHLTNVAIQKKAEGYDKSKGCKWLMTQVCRYLRTKHGNAPVDEMLDQLYSLILTSLRAVQSRMAVDRHCFEIYGYDVLIDKDLKPWLIEVNASASLTADTPTDYQLKVAMLEDAFHVLDLEHR